MVSLPDVLGQKKSSHKSTVQQIFSWLTGANVKGSGTIVVPLGIRCQGGVVLQQLVQNLGI